MLILLIISTIVMTLCILLHYRQHFEWKPCNSKSNRSKAEIRASTKDGMSSFYQINCCCTTKPDQEFDFFPLSFLLYMIFMLTISILIVSKYIYEETPAVHMFYHHDISYNIYTKLTISHINDLSSLVLLSYLDWIIYILIVFAMSWESLFSFYRYYTTAMSAKYCYSLSFIDILKHFVIYLLIYTLFFIIQTQIYYFLFPFILVLYASINIYWISKSSKIIIKSVQHITRLTDKLQTDNLQIDLLSSVRLLRNLNILSLVLTLIYIALFIILYNIKIVYYFPCIWSISMVFFVCNFIRNRQFIANIRSHCNCKQQFASELVNNFPSAIPRTTVTELEQTENKFVVCVEYIDQQNEEKPAPNNKRIATENKDGQIQIKTDVIQTPLPLYCKPDAFQTAQNKSNSTGDLISLLIKNKIKNKTKTPRSVPVHINNVTSNPYLSVVSKQENVISNTINDQQGSLYKETMQYFSKPMNQLILPNVAFPRSSSNPLIAPTKAGNESITTLNYLITPSVPKTYSHSSLEFEQISSTPQPLTTINNTLTTIFQHAKSRSGNDILQFDESANGKNKKRKRRTDRNMRRHSKHIQNESVSVASVVNLIVAQGLYDKKSAKRILKSNF